MSEIAKAYEPQEVEARWDAAWEEAKCFKGVLPEDTSAVEPHSIVIPPPNVTGVLHMGHILNNTIQDILTRRARQQGKAAVWVPGTDHAGIATQARVERELRKEGKTRHDLGREKFVEKACEWRDEHGGIILKQLRKLGASCDWGRTVHTLDEGYSRAVLTAFVELYQKGMIYRGKRMVNWCPVSLTALSDEEVIMKPQQGFLYKMRYEIAERPGEYVEISTTRPETIMGDTGVAIHPEDERYKHLHGLHAVRPFPRAEIPFVPDEHVDREFGTGVLKVTPAHDQADWDIGKRHNLPAPIVITADGKVDCPEVPELHGKDRFEARKLAVKLLEAQGLLIEAEKYENNVGFSERADVPIEPRPSDQWWLKYPKVEEAKEAVRSGAIKFYPQRWEKVYLHWLDNIQDWCISRQLWWGHRIPVWYKKGLDRSKLTDEDFQNPELVHVSVDGPADPENWDQEEDVLDTWASSWLWPFGTFGWPEGSELQKKELDFWYPTAALATGPDIIFFWVARMIMAGLEFMGDVPFKTVYFNGIIRDGKGRKMSKSLGNSPDPLELIALYGADSMRLGMLMIAPKGQDVLFDFTTDPQTGAVTECPPLQQGRNFCNKLWNACRFRLMQQEEGASAAGSLEDIIARLEPAKFDADDHAILGSLVETLDAYDKDLSAYEFNAVTQQIYKFFWSDFCDWYVEVSKTKMQDPELKANCLAIQDLCLRQLLLMLYPLTPFITEQLWHDMGYAAGEDDFIQNYAPGTGTELKAKLLSANVTLDQSAMEEVEALRDFVQKARALKAQYNLAAKRDVTFYIVGDAANRTVVESHGEKLKRLVGAAGIEPRDDVQDAPASVTALGTLYLDLASSVDTEAEKKRLGKELEKLAGAIRGAEAKLGNEKFTGKAPAEVVEGVRQTLAENKAKAAELERLMASFG
ncbi:valine--tRNA ligase [Ruficoccus sp. ZRK36]|uniref:valine--tRNA ligase n=1 Tax=Ruficoccus sp. ZRK36 TaxID=2866311 RepID=UPI001C731F31|nr:valine--tRNA ligase [Ruficoccus sp. ZRK36]QYY36036.1 valine--tRNA ligase [Ruficoccus sp. ZRK36]